MTLKSFLKGLSGELQSTLAKKVFLDANVYEDINNVTLPTSNGTTQIDHIIVSRFGIFVVETKNMSGWIFGRTTHKQFEWNGASYFIPNQNLLPFPKQSNLQLWPVMLRRTLQVPAIHLQSIKM